MTEYELRVIGTNVKIVFVQRGFSLNLLFKIFLKFVAPDPLPFLMGGTSSPFIPWGYPLKRPTLEVYYNKYAFSGFLESKD